MEGGEGVRSEDGGEGAVERREEAQVEVGLGTEEERGETHRARQVEGYDETTQGASDETFPGLFRRKFDQWGSSKKHPEDIGHSIISNYTEIWKQVPINSLV